jgi:hypothetical protein
VNVATSVRLSNLRPSSIKNQRSSKTLELFRSAHEADCGAVNAGGIGNIKIEALLEKNHSLKLDKYKLKAT